LLDPHSGALKLSAQRGFEAPFLKFFEAVRVRGGDSVCGEAIGSVKRVVTEDVSKSDILKGQPSLEVLLQAGVRAVQSTPLLSSNGRLLGVISTHFSESHLLGERESRLMDLLARQAADYLERRQTEEELRQGAEQIAEAHQELEKRVQERTAKLNIANQNLQQLSAHLLHSQDEERRRLARELHDSVGQLLTAIKMNSAAFQSRKLDPDLQKVAMDNSFLIDQLLREIRTMSHLLHPPLLDEVGLASALRWYVDGYSERSKIAVELDIAPDIQRLGHDMEIAIFRVVQECLTNIHRHSGSPNAVVRLAQEDGQIRLEVKDEGKGIPVEKQLALSSSGHLGVGFRGMRERVHQLGGSLEVQSDVAGTTIIATLPIAETTMLSAQEVA